MRRRGYPARPTPVRAPGSNARAPGSNVRSGPSNLKLYCRSHMDQVDVSRVMADIRMRASAELRERAFDRGNTPEFSDAELFDIVEQILRSAVDESDRKVLLLPEIIAGSKDLTLEPAARLTSHRPLVGPLIVFVKRRLLQPLTQW